MRSSRFSMVVLLSALFLSVVFLAGCGGGDGSGQGGQNGGQAKKGEGGKGSKGKDRKAGDRKERTSQAETKIAIGQVMRVAADRNVVVVKASQGEGEPERMVFKLRKKRAQVLSDGQEVELADAKEDQQIKVEYVVRDDLNRARTVTLFSTDDQAEDGQPSGEEEPAGEGNN